MLLSLPKSSTIISLYRIPYLLLTSTFRLLYLLFSSYGFVFQTYSSPLSRVKLHILLHYILKLLKSIYSDKFSLSTGTISLYFTVIFEFPLHLIFSYNSCTFLGYSYFHFFSIKTFFNPHSPCRQL